MTEACRSRAWAFALLAELRAAGVITGADGAYTITRSPLGDG
jgi:hypothetical protein